MHPAWWARGRRGAGTSSASAEKMGSGLMRHGEIMVPFPIGVGFTVIVAGPARASPDRPARALTVVCCSLGASPRSSRRGWIGFNSAYDAKTDAETGAWRVSPFASAFEHGGARAKRWLVHARMRVSGPGPRSFALRGAAVGSRGSCMYACVG